MGRDAMTVVYWANPLKQRQGGLGADAGRTKPTKLHVNRDYNKGNLPSGWLLPATPDAEVDLRCIGSARADRLSSPRAVEGRNNIAAVRLAASRCRSPGAVGVATASDALDATD